jgi:hypothetical protein
MNEAGVPGTARLAAANLREKPIANQISLVVPRPPAWL